jgi:hypothetical protein
MSGNKPGLPDEVIGDSASARPEAARLSVSLVAKAASDLRRVHERTQLSRTDIINRAVSLYEFIDSELSDGAELIVRRDGIEHHVKLL